MANQWLFGWSCLLIAMFSVPVQATEDTMIIRHLGASYSPALGRYLVDVLTQILDTTEEEYGPYRLEVIKTHLTRRRAEVETEKGQLLNVLFTAGTLNEGHQNSNIESFELPLFNDLLGLRDLLVVKPLFDSPPESRQDFIQPAAGLGNSWDDVAIFQNSHIRVVEAPRFEVLFSMLANRRFDYLPLSVLESQETLKASNVDYPQISIASGAYIFYPMVFGLHVNVSEPRRAERFRLGVKRLTPKMLQALFDQHFPDFAFESKTNSKLFIAQNPRLSATKNQLIIARFLERYGHHFDVLQ